MNGVGTATQELALGKSIALARRKAGLTQQQLCVKANLSYSTLAKIERGAIKTPSVFTVAAIAGATGTTMEALTGISLTHASTVPQKAYKTSRNGIKFVYFDVNGVLVHYYQRAFTKIAADTGAKPDIVEALFWHYNDAACRGELSLEEFENILAEKIGVKKISWTDYYLNSLEPVKEMHDALLWAAQYYRVGLMSNIMAGQIKAMINRGVLPNIPYEAIADSSELGAIKPEAAMYKKAAELGKVKPQEILLIDDNRTNLMAAEQMGWHVLWFDDYRPGETETQIKQTLEF